MASETQICNGALQRLGKERISSLSDASKAARACNFVYADERDKLLRKHLWGFARARVQLAADSVGPAFGPANYFTLPSDCLRILKPTDRIAGVTIAQFFGMPGRIFDWQIEGRKIVTSWSAPLDVVYIRQVTDPNMMDVLFRDLLEIRIAFRTCKELTDSNQLKESLRIDMKEATTEAKRANAFESISGDLPEDDFITVRC